MNLMAEVAFGFMSPETRKRIREQERARVERLLVSGVAVPWDEDNTKFAKELVIDGTTFKPTKLFECPTTPCVQGPYKFSMINPDHKFEYANVRLPRGDFLELFQGSRRGRVGFTTDVVLPTLRVSTAHPQYREHQTNVWMSVTPAEVLSQRQGIKLARGKVMLGGLGLGWLMRKILAKKSVTEMVVVEESQSLLDWYGDRICEQASNEFGKKVKVICGDARYHLGKHGPNTRYIVDIWSSYPTEAWELKRSEWLKPIQRVKYFWGWGCPPHNHLKQYR